MSCVSLLETNKVLECYPGAMYAKLYKDMIRVRDTPWDTIEMSFHNLEPRKPTKITSIFDYEFTLWVRYYDIT